MAAVISLFGLLLFLLPLGYLALLMIASVRNPTPAVLSQTSKFHRFLIAIPAHNEANVIRTTVEGLKRMDYPPDMYQISVVADHCTDETAQRAVSAGAQVLERNEEPRGGKGYALNWLFQQLLPDSDFDAVIIFDADTQVDPAFLRFMNAKLAQGFPAIQGQHVISNPEGGWFPALTGAMFLVDNRFQNQGRSNLGWSAKNMGDSICLRADILQELGWGQGLTEDYYLRQVLLLNGIKITYEPAAKGYGDAAYSWAEAKAQRARWLQGTYQASQQLRGKLLREGLKRRNAALLDGALQGYFPSYSTLTMIAMILLVCQLLANLLFGRLFPTAVIYLWLAAAAFLFFHPLVGLALEKAPARAYLAMLSGPLFVVWRTWVAVTARFGRQPVTWIRTSHERRDPS